MSEAQNEHEQRQPLLRRVENTEVYPIIHMVKAVSGKSSLHATQATYRYVQDAEVHLPE